ncbi:MAG: 3-deoxy-D-manno-octulosonic acid transferase [Candidatus Aceula meridiana]|nr:3-deoxy-D-manno-octulosonic acid transferase [Candidatus Aceula meridiana]
MFILYDLVFLLFSIFYFLILVVKGKLHKGFLMRFGALDAKALGLNNKKKIWIHAVSVGEVLVVKNLIKKIHQCFLGYQIIISTVTKTGYNLAKSIAKDEDVVIFAPLDFSFVVRKYIRILQPQIFINTETEIWPNLLTALHKRGIPIVQVNGRISDKAFEGYQRLKVFIKPVLGYVWQFCMQTDRDANRIRTLGASSNKVHVVGNIKFDDIPEINDSQLKGLRVDDNEEILVAGSTHSGEEEIVLNLFKKIKKKFPSLRLIIAPRHPERTDEVCALVEAKKLEAVKFSQTHDLVFNQDTVVVVDTIGHLRALYSLAKIVFVGKSLTRRGGHNIIEPAYFEKPIIVGPYMDNFLDVTQLFLDNNAIIQVKDEKEFVKVVQELLKDEARCEELGLKAREVIENQQGAVDKTINIISNILV